MRSSVVVSAIIGLLVVGAVVFGRLAFTADAEPEAASSADRVPELRNVLPLDGNAYRAAAEVALVHSDAYGTYESGETGNAYTERVRAAAPLADMPEGPDLGAAAACFARLAEEGRAAEGSAEIRGTTYLGADSVHFAIALSAVPAEGGAAIELGTYNVLVILEAQEWVVASSAEAGADGSAAEGGAAG
ncbi:hypothetical protein [Nocardiopsis coralliicola]